VQEALTNTLKHSAARSAHIELTYSEQNLTVEVRDDGPGRHPLRVTNGAGLLGMRERVATVRGHLDTGPDQGGGFAVRAHLPTPDATT
jgi:signal transduction histidine kinase